jgi:hypothetical protein
MGSDGITPHVFNLGTRWRWVVIVTPWPLYPWEKSPPINLGVEAGWTPEPVWTQWREKIAAPSRNLTLVVQPVQPWHYTEWAILYKSYSVQLRYSNIANLFVGTIACLDVKLSPHSSEFQITVGVGKFSVQQWVLPSLLAHCTWEFLSLFWFFIYFFVILTWIFAESIIYIDFIPNFPYSVSIVPCHRNSYCWRGANSWLQLFRDGRKHFFYSSQTPTGDVFKWDNSWVASKGLKSSQKFHGSPLSGSKAFSGGTDIPTRAITAQSV